MFIPKSVVFLFVSLIASSFSFINLCEATLTAKCVRLHAGSPNEDHFDPRRAVSRSIPTKEFEYLMQDAGESYLYFIDRKSPKDYHVTLRSFRLAGEQEWGNDHDLNIQTFIEAFLRESNETAFGAMPGESLKLHITHRDENNNKQFTVLTKDNIDDIFNLKKSLCFYIVLPVQTTDERLSDAKRIADEESKNLALFHPVMHAFEPHITIAEIHKYKKTSCELTQDANGKLKVVAKEGHKKILQSFNTKKEMTAIKTFFLSINNAYEKNKRKMLRSFSETKKHLSSVPSFFSLNRLQLTKKDENGKIIYLLNKMIKTS